MKKVIIIFSLINVCLLFSYCDKEDKVPYNGTLTGEVKYTGASNMEIDNVIITLRGIDDNTEKNSKRISGAGEYKFELPSGKYALNLEGNLCYSKNLPDTVTVNAGKTTPKDINIEQLPSSMVILYNNIEHKSGDTITLSSAAVLDIWNKYSSKNLQWNIRAYPQPSWISFEATNGTVTGGGRKSVVFSIDKSKMTNYGVNYSEVILTTEDNGSFTVRVSAVKNSNLGSVELSNAGIMVQKTDVFNSYVIWTEANNLCNCSEIDGYTDWHLPNLTEISAIFDSEELIGGFKHYGQGTSYHAYYWTRTGPSVGKYYAVNIDYHDDFVIKEDNVIFWQYGNSVAAAWARCVRNLP